MVHILALANHHFVAMEVLEILHLPAAGGINGSFQDINEDIRTCFTRILSSFHRNCAPDRCAAELLLHACPDGYGAGRVRTFLVIRSIADNRTEGENFVRETVSAICRELEESNISVSVFSAPSDYSQLTLQLEQAEGSRVYSVSRKEKALMGAIPTAGMLYYLQTPPAAGNPDPRHLYAALARCPGSVISLQLLPTCYSDGELGALRTVRNVLGQQAAYLRYRRGLATDPTAQTVLDAYDTCLQAANEPLFQYNFLIWSSPEGAALLADRMCELLDKEGAAAESAADVVDVTDLAMTPADNLFASPWIRSDLLVREARNTGFWNTPQAPAALQRLKQLLPLCVVRSVFTLPADPESKNTGSHPFSAGTADDFGAPWGWSDLTMPDTDNPLGR